MIDVEAHDSVFLKEIGESQFLDLSVGVIK